MNLEQSCLNKTGSSEFKLDHGIVIDVSVIAVFLAVILAGILVPVYADEVALRIMRSTFFSEQGRILTLLPQCGSDLGLALPWSLFPAAIGTSLLVSNLPPFGIRLAGLATAVLWLALLVIVVRTLVPNGKNQLRWLSAMLAVLGVGVLPLTLVLARSEQWLLLLLTAFTLFPFVAQWIGRVQVRIGLAGLFLLFCLLVSFAFYAHPKALFFLPLLGVSAYFSFYARSRFAFFAAVAFLLWTAFQTVEITRLLVACPDAPVFSNYMASQTTKLGLLLEAPVATLTELLGNVWAAPDRIIKHLGFQLAYQSAWLPPAQFSELSKPALLANLAVSSVFKLVIWAAVLLPLATLWLSIRRRDFGLLFFMSQGLWVGFVGQLAIYRAWNFYGGALVLGLAVLLILLSAVQVRWADRGGIFWHWLRAGLAFIFFGSATVLATEVVPGMYRAIGSEEVGLKSQPLSVPVFGFPDQRNKIREFAAGCSMSGDGARRLVVDDLTYFAFDNLREPLHLVYFYEGGFGVDVKGVAVIQMLERLGVEGIVAQCTFMPSVLMEWVRREGNLCCVKFPLSTAGR